MQTYQEQIDNEKQFKPKLYQYPQWQQPSAVFDYEDLENEETLLVLCVRAEPGNPERDQNTVFVWRGGEFDPATHLDGNN